MASCDEVYAALARLEAKIDAIPRVDEESIINKSVNKAQSILKPEIFAIGTVAAYGVAQAGKALAEIVALLARLAKLAGSLAALRFLINPLLILPAAVYGLQLLFMALTGRLDGMDAKIAKLAQRIEQVNGVALSAEEKAEVAYDFANLSVKRSNEAIQKANVATEKAEKAEKQSNLAIKNSNEAIAESNSAKIVAEQALGGARQATQKANMAVGEANTAKIQANEANNRANFATAKANNAASEAQLAKSEANKATDTAKLATSKANQAGLKADAATLKANQSFVVAEVASYTANDAINKSNKAIYDSNIASAKADIATHKANRATYEANIAIAETNKLNSRVSQNEKTTAQASNTANTALENSNGAVIISRGALTISQSTGITAEDNKQRIAALENKTYATTTPSTGVTSQQAKAEQERQRRAIAEVKTQVRQVSNNNQALTVEVAKIRDRVNEDTEVNRSVIPTLKDIQQKVSGLSPQVAAIPAATAIALAPAIPSLARIGDTVRTNVCEVTKPNGCLGAPLKGIRDKVNGLGAGLGAAAGAGLSAAQLALLYRIDINTSKMAQVLGTNVIPGGLSQGFSRMVNWVAIDRIVNLITLCGVLHNCSMLSTSIFETFFSMLDNIFAIPALIKNSEAETIDTKEVFTKQLDSFFIGLFGATEWAAIKAQWKAFSTIYSTGAQVFGNIRDIFDETNNINEITKNWVAELGNGLQNEGLIGEDNWKPKDDDDDEPKGKYFGRLEKIRQGLETTENVFEDLEQVTQSARSIVETANEIKENTDAIKKAIDDANKEAKKDRDAKIEKLELPNFSLDDLY